VMSRAVRAHCWCARSLARRASLTQHLLYFPLSRGL
jgi:hypothetical protein